MKSWRRSWLSFRSSEKEINRSGGRGVVKVVAPGHRSSAGYYSPSTKIAAISFGVAQYCELGASEISAESAATAEPRAPAPE